MVGEKKHILVVDDDTRLRSLLSRYLIEQGYMVSSARDVENAKSYLSSYIFDMLIIDVMMPNITGVEFLKELRAEKNEVPVILLTAMGDTADRIIGLSLGADDYIAKPFEPQELVLRINNILKRSGLDKNISSQLKFSTSLYDLDRGELLDLNGGVIHITPVERTLLNYFGQRVSEVHSREELAELLGVDDNLRTVDVQITRLRKKIEIDTKNPRYIQTVRGRGYMLITD